MSKPTLLQSLFNKPSRKYATISHSHRTSRTTSYADPSVALPLPLILDDEKDPSIRNSFRLSLDSSPYDIPTITAQYLPYAASSEHSLTLTLPRSRNSSISKNRPSSKPFEESQPSEVGTRSIGTPPPKHQDPMHQNLSPSPVFSPTNSTALKQQLPLSFSPPPPSSTDNTQSKTTPTRVHGHAVAAVDGADFPHAQQRQAEGDSSSSDDETAFFTPRSSADSSPSDTLALRSEPLLSAPSLVEALTTDTSAATVTGSISRLPPSMTLPLPRQMHRVSWSDQVMSSINSIPSSSSTAPASASSSVTSLSDSLSDFGLNNSSYAPSESTAPTSVQSNSKPSTLRKEQVVTRSSSQGKKRRSAGISSGASVTSSTTATDPDWAKDVRWLVKPESTRGQQYRSWTQSATNSERTTPVSSRAPSVVGDHDSVSPPIRRRSLESPGDYLRDVYVPQKPPKPINSPPKRLSTNSVLSASSSESTSTPRKPRYRPPPPSLESLSVASTSAPAVDPRLVRMSAVLEADEDGNEVIIGTARPEVLHRHIAASTERLTKRRSTRVRTTSDPTSDARPQSSVQRAASVRSKSSTATSTTTYKTVGLATTLQVSDASASTSHQNGYTSLVLPRAAYTPGKNPISNEVDLTRSGLAQTTMSTISIIKHAAAPSNLPSKRRLSGFFSFSRSSSSTSKGKARDSEPERSLALTSTTPPPHKLPSSSILVQIHATAIDALDRLLVRQHSSKAEGYGYVPGRSFVGRVVEAGWEISHLGKGDWVVGLLEMNTRMGALAEFVVVDRKRVTRVPNPHSMTGAKTKAMGSEEMAMIPLVGLPALRAARTVPKMMASDGDEDDENAKSTTPPSGRPRMTMNRSLSTFVDQPKEKRKVLVLGAQSAIGTMTVVYLKSMGLIVTAHLLASHSHDMFYRTLGMGKTGGDDDMEIVVDDDVERAMGRIPDSTFRLVVDTVGGKDVWKAAKRVLDPNGGQFTTTMGDTPSVIPTRNLHVKANMRSLRHAFRRGKDDRAVGYAWVCPAVDVDHDGEDVRDTLKAVVELAVVKGVGMPVVEKVVPFERTPVEAFGTTNSEDGEETRPVVVKVVG